MKRKALMVLLCLGLILGMVPSLQAEGVELTEVGTYPIVEEPIEMTMFRVAMPNVIDFETNDFTLHMEELTNIKWNFRTANSDNAEMQINLEMSSADKPDAFMFGTPNIAQFGVRDQLLLQLDDLIEPNMPNLVAYMEENPAVKVRITQTDGHIYSTPAVNQCYHCTFRNKMWVNEAHLEELGLEVPTTTEEFKAVLEAYMEANPTGIGIGGSIDGWGQQFFDWISNAFFLDPGTSTAKLTVSPEGVIESTAVMDEYREALKYMRELFDMGAIYEGSLTQNHEQYRSLMNEAGEPVLFAPYGTISDAFDATSNPEAYANYRVLSPIEGPEGARYATFFRYDGVGAGGFVLSDTAKYPEAALRWIDYFYTLEGYLSMQFGADEGEDWVLNSEGLQSLGGGDALYKVINTYSSDPQNHDWQDVGLNFATNEIRLGAAVDQDVDLASPEGLEKLLYVETEEKCEPFAQGEGDYDVLPALYYTADEADALQLIAQEVSDFIEQNRLAFIMGTQDIHNDDEWQAYVDAFDTYGLPEYIEIAQAAYDRQTGN